MIGADGLCIDLESWKKFSATFEEYWGLRIILIIGEKVTQWYDAQNSWDIKDWCQEIEEKYWVTIELKEIVKASVTKFLFKKVLSLWEEGLKSQEL